MNQEVIRIKQEDKKALKKFWVIIVFALILGALSGFGLAFAKFSYTSDMGDRIRQAAHKVIPYGIPVVTISVLLAVATIYRKSRRIFAAWDGEEEESLSRAETWMSYALWLTSVNTIWNFFIYAAAFVTGIWEDINAGTGFNQVMLFSAEFLAAIFVCIIEQQKLVNLEKEINPEKYGSVYDVKFQKKWEDSCDEAEKLAIYKSGYRAYKIVQRECSILWTVCMLAGFIWEIGVLPVLLVSVIWATLTTGYCMEAIRLSKKGNR